MYQMPLLGVVEEAAALVEAGEDDDFKGWRREEGRGPYVLKKL